MLNEVHSLGSTLVLVTRPSLQASALLQYLKSTLDISGKVQNIHRIIEETVPDSILIFDMMEADKRLVGQWQDNLGRKNNGMKLVLLNTPEEYPFKDIENWPHINGVFYNNETESRLIEGLNMIMHGECYFSHKLASYLITHSGNYRYNNAESAMLTQREREILNKLRVGASNVEIARSLFISENTVKTHLYNLFKKLAVKNRTQAVSWANDNLRR
ncbi:biofilm master transcriptional regulator CsgD [Enterobacteriaceae bacterium C23F]